MTEGEETTWGAGGYTLNYEMLRFAQHDKRGGKREEARCGGYKYKAKTLDPRLKMSRMTKKGRSRYYKTLRLLRAGKGGEKSGIRHVPGFDPGCRGYNCKRQRRKAKAPGSRIKSGMTGGGSGRTGGEKADSSLCSE